MDYGLLKFIKMMNMNAFDAEPEHNFNKYYILVSILIKIDAAGKKK